MGDIKNLKTDGQRGPGGASRCSGGRDEPQRSLATSAAIPAFRRWVPPSSIKRDAYTIQEKNDIVFRRVRGILNKITPDKFHKLSNELLSTGLDSPTILKGVILLICEKALDEPKYSSMYAQLCRKLSEEAPNFDNNNEASTFRRLLLSKCQDEFENRSRATELFDQKDGLLTPDEEDQRSLAKHKMLGNIKFIGELGKLEMLHESILHKCIQQLLEKKKCRRGGIKDMAEDLECLCQIMRTCGRILDTEKARSLMDQYFDRMKTLASNQELPSRIRFMLQDLLELRERKRWVPRKVLTDNGPKTIQQVREEAAKDIGYYLPPPNVSKPYQVGMLPPMRGLQSRGGMDDVFGLMPIENLNLGTGPGVIATDNFNGYMNNMGRQNRNNMQNPGQFPIGGGQVPMSVLYNRPNMQSNQGNMFNQQQQHNNSSKDVPPRFMKKTQLNADIDEISLRPAQNSMILKPKSSNFASKLTNSTQPSFINNHQESMLNSVSTLNNQKSNLINPQENSVPIKQVAADKNKANKKDQSPSKAEVLKKMEEFLNEFLPNPDYSKASITLKDVKIPKNILPDVMAFLMTKTLDKSDNDRETVCKLFTNVKQDTILTSSQFIEGFKRVLLQMSDLEVDVPRVKSYVAVFAAHAVIAELATLAELAEPLENGAHYPLFPLCLQQLHKLQGKQWLSYTFNESKVNLQNMLPEIDRTKERLMDVLEDRGLSFLFPLLRIQADLWKQMQIDPNPGVFYKWVKENVDVNQQTQPGFINALISCLLKYITQKSTLADGIDTSVAPDKALQEKEKELLEKYKPVFQAFLHDHVDLQVIALYTLQVHCYNNNFPKGMLLRWFILLYSLEIIEEEAFLQWKEDISDQYPGKGKALFQVNQWLTWLEEAEEEEEEGSDCDN